MNLNIIHSYKVLPTVNVYMRLQTVFSSKFAQMSHLYAFSTIWILKCDFKELASVNADEQTSQMNDFSPLCMLESNFSRFKCLNANGQTSHLHYEFYNVFLNFLTQ